jgi:hypothetical protein
MAFKGFAEAEARLRDPAKLSPQEVRDLMPWMPNISVAGERRLTAELALQNLEAVQKFEKSSSRLTWWLIGLTGALVVLTLAVVYYSHLLAHAETRTNGASAVSRPEAKTPQASASKATLGPWNAKFSIPGSVELPKETPVIKCSFSKSREGVFGYIGVTVVNVSDHSYVVRYNIYGYDQNGRRISEGSDEFAIGKHETVLRNVSLQSQESILGKLGSVFWVQMVLEQ